MYRMKTKATKVLVCGDRRWASRLIIMKYLEALKPSLVIEGEAKGADTMARIAAEELGIPVQKFPAEWGKYGKAAGPIRNKQMLDEKPDLVLAFHFDIEGSSGTANCLCQAEDRGIDYYLVG